MRKRLQHLKVPTDCHTFKSDQRRFWYRISVTIMQLKPGNRLSTTIALAPMILRNGHLGYYTGPTSCTNSGHLIQIVLNRFFNVSRTCGYLKLQNSYTHPLFSALNPHLAVNEVRIKHIFIPSNTSIVSIKFTRSSFV